MNRPSSEQSQPLQESTKYPARTGYLDENVVSDYEQTRFGGVLGRYRNSREQSGVGRILSQLPAGLEVLDVPCGNGRWWPALEPHATKITARDISPTMLASASEKAPEMRIPISVEPGDAEDLDLDDNSVDLVFSHALTKHLPIPVQHRVLAEFSRVSRRWVVCSFSLFGPLTYQVWRRRNFLDSYPLLPEQLEDIAKGAGLEIVAKERCTTPIGVEYSVLLERVVR